MDAEAAENEAMKRDSVDRWVPQNDLKRKYDIVVFGASGFTGQFVVLETARFCEMYSLTWAVAGRSIDKIQKVLAKMCKTLDGFENKTIDIIYADVQEINTVVKMAQVASVVINCTGPYYIYGEVVVKTCVLNSTHYVDVTGESLFMEKMAYTYNKDAEKNGSIIVSALGMESVPADLGVEFLYNKFDGKLENVDVYMKLYSNSYVLKASALIHDGTWISAILHLATRKQGKYYRKLLDESERITRKEPTVSKILHKQQISMLNDKKDWCIAFPEPDQSVIVRSLHHAKTVENRYSDFQVRNYMVFGGLIASVIALIVFTLMSFVVTFEPIRILFVRFPKLFSLGMATKTGPDEKLMENSRLSLTLIGYGSTSVKHSLDQTTENKSINNNCTRKTAVKVKAKNPGYGFTSKAVVLGAITILKDKESLPKGGVLTPAAAFRNTNYMNRLIEHDAASFEVESDVVVYK